MTLLRAVRLLRGESLDLVAAAVDTRKAWLSVAERFPHRHISLKLRKRIAKHFGADFNVLSASIDTNALAAALISQATTKEKVCNA